MFFHNKNIFKCIAAAAAVCICVGSTAGCSEKKRSYIDYSARSYSESLEVSDTDTESSSETSPATTVADTTAKDTTTTVKDTTKDTENTTKKTTKKSTQKTTAVDSKKNASGVKNPDYKSKYYIVVYVGSQSTVIYGKDDTGAYNVIYQSFTCSTGKKSSPTDLGMYKVKSKYRWRLLVGNVYAQYSSGIGNDYLFHSVPYKKKTVSSLDNAEYDKLGSPASHGCIRLCVRDSKWIYDNVPIGTQVNIVSGSGPAGAPIPKRIKESDYNGWDPSDKWAKDNPYFKEPTTTSTTVTTTTTTETSAVSSFTETTSTTSAAAA